LALVGVLFVVVLGAWYFFFSGGDNSPVYPKGNNNNNNKVESKPRAHTHGHSPTPGPSNPSTTNPSPLPPKSTCTDTEKLMLAGAASLLSARVYEIAEKKEGVFQGMGHIGEAMPEFHWFYLTAKNRTEWVKTVCEVGFNAGHSALAFLIANPELKYIAFDTMTLKWTIPMIKYMNDAFGDRITPVPGFSAQSVPEWKPPEGFTGCDVISADGKHNDPEPYIDVVNMAKHAKTGAVVLADDWSDNFPDVKKAWQRFKDEGLVHEVGCFVSGLRPGGFAKNWCHGVLKKGGYPAHPNNLDAKELGLI